MGHPARHELSREPHLEADPGALIHYMKASGLLRITRRYVGDDGQEKVAPSLPIGSMLVVCAVYQPDRRLLSISWGWVAVRGAAYRILP